MEKDIHTLIKRFMAGQTSIEEEDRIAEYLRTHDVGEDLQPYKEMFAWFDQGMPLGSQQEDEETSLRGDKSTRGQVNEGTSQRGNKDARQATHFTQTALPVHRRSRGHRTAACPYMAKSRATTIGR